MAKKKGKLKDAAVSMVKKSRLKDAAVSIGSAVGKVDSTAHSAVRKAAKAGHVTKLEIVDLTKQVDALRRQLKKSAKRLKNALK